MIDPRDIYQADMVRQNYDAWSAGARAVLDVLPTGGGKSKIIARHAADGEAAGDIQAIIAHRTELVSQLSGHVASCGIMHRVIAPKQVVAQIVQQHRNEYGRSFVNPDARASVVAVDTLIARKEILTPWARQVRRWTIDECFPAGTLVETLSGKKSIESVKIGDYALAFDERTNGMVYRKVVRLFKNLSPRIMFDISTNGVKVSCTSGHPFWTQRGWVLAKDLTTDDYIYREMHTVRQSVSNRKGTPDISSSENRKHILHNEMWDDLQGCEKKATREETTCNKVLHSVSDCTLQKRKDLLQEMSSGHIVCDNEQHKPTTCVRKNDAEQSYEICRSAEQNVCDTKEGGTQTKGARRQWRQDTGSRTKVDRNFDPSRLYSANADQNQHETRERLASLLQTRHGAPCSEDCNRSGRPVTPILEAPSARPEERCFFAMSRVDGVEVYEPTNTGRTGDGFVYNIEVDEVHTYVANGIIVHNCHHVLRLNKWGEAVSMFPNAFGLGVTASPERADGKGLGAHHDGVFNHMVVGPTMRELINMAALCDYEMVCPTSDLVVDEKDFNKDGDLSPKKGRLASKKSRIVGDIVKQYAKYALGKRTIVFVTDVETAHEVATNFNNHGIAAAAVSAKTPSGLRDDYIKRFRDGRLTVLVNVDLFGEGFDVPACECVIMARPTGSLAVYLQQFGRALRLLAGKLYGLIIDMVSNFKRHGFPDKQHNWTLDRREKKARDKDPEELDELTKCGECSRPYLKVLPSCPHCGAEPLAPEGGGRTLEQVDGDMTLLDRDALAAMRAAMVLEPPASVAERVEAVAGPAAAAATANKQMARIVAQRALADALAQWAGLQRSKGRSDREIDKRFFAVTNMSVPQALAMSRQDMEAMTNKVKEWMT